jgi:hypothetical protein
MPLSNPSTRREIHHRRIDMKVYVRDDGLYDVEAQLVDKKPFEFRRAINPLPLPAGESLHDLSIRITVDSQFVIRDIEASSDATPYRTCKQAEGSLSVMIGQRIGSGWSKRVKASLMGVTGCTHLTELLIPMATATLQGINGIEVDRNKRSNIGETPQQLNSCYSYSADREVVKILWPHLYTGDA